jgi:virginiamycin A acetyltransferase
MITVAKRFLNSLAAVFVFPLVLWYRLQGLIFGSDRAFPSCVQLLSLLPGTTGISLRRAFLRQVIRHCGTDVCVSFGTVFSDPGLSLGRSVYLGHFCSVGNVTIEDDVLIASHVSIMNGCEQHGTGRLDIPIREQPGTWREITIGRNSWIGEHAVVAANVGRNCLIGAGALVIHDVPDYSVAVGVPARVIRDRREQADVALPKD